MSDVAVIDFTCCEESVRAAFNAVNGADVLAGFDRILLKPNLVNGSPFPVTTHPDFTAAVVMAVRERSDATVVVAEGCGGAAVETPEVFAALGYIEMAEVLGVELLDLNHAPLVKREILDCPVFPEMWLPEVAFTHAVVSLPVLKAHSLATITGTMKNMMGFPPPAHYQTGGAWKKSAFHQRMHQAVVDLNRYVTPCLTLMDASVGMAQYHLGGPQCQPAVGKILAGTDPLALDREAAGLLGVDWRTVGHLADPA